jgi:hypothetical protein
MKAHRRLAKNTALIECCHVAAEKANWQLSAQAKQASSLRDGGGERGLIPNFTATDQQWPGVGLFVDRLRAQELNPAAVITAASKFDPAPGQHRGHLAP